jgi:uncharacterized CHY-type Zn-finger protein
MKHKRFTTILTYILCGKCSHKWFTKGYFDKNTCPKCKHEDTTMNSL